MGDRRTFNMASRELVRCSKGHTELQFPYQSYHEENMFPPDYYFFESIVVEWMRSAEYWKSKSFKYEQYGKQLNLIERLKEENRKFLQIIKNLEYWNDDYSQIKHKLLYQESLLDKRNNVIAWLNEITQQQYKENKSLQDKNKRLNISLEETEKFTKQLSDEVNELKGKESQYKEQVRKLMNNEKQYEEQKSLHYDYQQSEKTIAKLMEDIEELKENEKESKKEIMRLKERAHLATQQEDKIKELKVQIIKGEQHQQEKSLLDEKIQYDSYQEEQIKDLKDKEKQYMKDINCLKSKVTELTVKLDEKIQQNSHQEERIKELEEKQYRKDINLLDEKEQHNLQQAKRIQDLEEKEKLYRKNIESLDSRVHELTVKLGKEMSVKIASDERNIENVSIHNRPMNIAEEYQGLCSSEWYEAKEDLDQLHPEMEQEKMLECLLNIMTIAENKSREIVSCLDKKLQQLIYQPIDFANANPMVDGSLKHEIPNGLKIAISDLWRKNEKMTNTVLIVNEICDIIKATYFKDGDLSKKIIDYITKCVQITWKMVLQRPQMNFIQRGIGQRFQDTTQEAFWSSSNPNDANSRVKYYIYPCLYHGNKIMVKGKVMVKGE